MVELESEGELTRTEVASFLREFADELEDGVGDVDQEERQGEIARDADEDEQGDAKRITLVVGGESATVSVPHEIEFEVDVGSRSPMFSAGVNQAIEFDLSWDVEDPDDLEEAWLGVE